MSHLKQHWIKYLWLVVFTAFIFSLYLRDYFTSAAAVVPVQTGQIGGPVINNPDSFAPLVVPASIVFDSVGNKYILDTNVVFKYDSNDNLIKTFKITDLDDNDIYCNSMSIDSSDNLYCAEASYSEILKYDSNGNLLLQFGSYGANDGQVQLPITVSVNPADNNIYVTDYHRDDIQIFDPAGNYLSKFGSTGSGDGQFSKPYSVAFDHNNDIYVLEFTGNRIQKFASTTHTHTSLNSEHLVLEMDNLTYPFI